MSRYGDNCDKHDLPYGSCIECERDTIRALRDGECERCETITKRLEQVHQHEMEEHLRTLETYSNALKKFRDHLDRGNSVSYNSTIVHELLFSLIED